MSPERLVRQLIQHEALRLKPYTDSVGKLTIGIGRNLTDRGISEDEARYLCANDIAAVTADLMRQFPWWRALTENDSTGSGEVRQRVIADMCFNMGIRRLLGFRALLAAMECHDYQEAAVEMLDSAWATQVGQRAVRLAEMMRTGKDMA